MVSHGSFVKSHRNKVDNRVRSCYYDTCFSSIILLLIRYYAITNNMNSHLTPSTIAGVGYRGHPCRTPYAGGAAEPSAAEMDFAGSTRTVSHESPTM